tara:strand:+ start:373 stop:525 length:153 start_codon:yes stop_codon:yes gene_type:complete
MNKKTKAKVGITSILITVGVSYLLQYWFKNELEDKVWNTYNDIKSSLWDK